FSVFDAEASAATDDWPAAVGLVETELRRALTQGFAPAEVQEDVAVRRTWARAAVDELQSKMPDAVASDIAMAIASGTAWPHPAKIAAYASEFTPTITPAEIAGVL